MFDLPFRVIGVAPDGLREPMVMCKDFAMARDIVDTVLLRQHPDHVFEICQGIRVMVKVSASTP